MRRFADRDNRIVLHVLLVLLVLPARQVRGRRLASAPALPHQPVAGKVSLHPSIAAASEAAAATLRLPLNAGRVI